MSYIARRAALVPIIAACFGCEPAPVEPPPRTAVSDSAGVDLIDNRIDPGSETVLQPRETLRIGSVDGPTETQFFLVRAIAVGPNEELYVATSRPPHVRVFSSPGTYLRTIGAPGEGPGEYADINGMFVSEDRVTVFDGRLSRVTVSTLDGQLIQASALVRREAPPPTPGANFDGGWVVFVPSVPTFPAHATFQDRISHFTVVTGQVDPLGALEAVGDSTRAAPVFEISRGRMVGMDMNGALTGQSPPWDAAQQWGVDRSGQIFVTSRDGYRIDVFDAQRTLTRSIRKSHEPVPITQETEALLLQAVVNHYDTVPGLTEFQTDPVDTYRFLLDLPLASSLPALGRLEVAADGSFMVERPDLVPDPVAMVWTRLGPQPTDWDLFASDGAYTGTVELPVSFTPHVFLGSAVLGVQRDELGVEFVVRYELERGGALQ